ncbi:MAG: hypothetical protein ABSE62_03000 [Chthoniobacteraceae bacterium]|jgi:hypothetical protein
MKHNTLSIVAVGAVALASACVALGQDSVTTVQQVQPIQPVQPVQATTTTTTTSAGVISDFSPQAIVVRTESAPEPVRYTYTRSTTYVDENGNPVSIETVKSGLPVTVYYEKEGDDLIASKVVVRTASQPPPPVNLEEQKTTTTTTTNK